MPLSPTANKMYKKGLFTLEPLDYDVAGNWVAVILWQLKPTDSTGDAVFARVP